MSEAARPSIPTWTWAAPLLAAVLAGVALAAPDHLLITAACTLALGASVVAAVHHAEVVAHRVGEPFGTLVLAVSVTVIEVALIVSLMLAGGPDAAALPRDTIFSAIMIICNGAIGLCLVVGGLRHYEQRFGLEGTTSALAALVALSALTLVLPSFTTSSPGPTYSHAQLAFAAVGSLALWSVFVFVQTVRHRDYFLPPDAKNDDEHAPPPTNRIAWISFGLLVACLLSVIGLAKLLSPTIEAAVKNAGLPAAVIGIVIAMLVLAPEAWAAARAARANRLQTSLNLALGSALATIGLTVPAVAAMSVVLDMPLMLGLGAKELTLLVLTFLVSSLTLGVGRTNVLQGAVHLLLFAAFLFLAVIP